jgi:uncharacterized protein (DUF488 family)
VLKRQKILLRVLREAKRPISHIELVKSAFLLRQETCLAHEPTFYDFVPYRFGPFSFALYRELAALARDGYIVDEKKTVRLSGRMKTESHAKSDDLPLAWKSAVKQTVAEYLSASQDELLRDVYCRYPWFARKSELKSFASGRLEPPAAPLAIYTVGYEGKSVDTFFNGLLTNGIASILDVRANPISRKYGFARKSMSEIAAKLDIDYFHLPELGISSSDRSSLSDFDSYQVLLDRYETEMLPDRGDVVASVVQLLQQKPSALLCMEKDVRCCHRGRLASTAAKKVDLQVSHI